MGLIEVKEIRELKLAIIVGHFLLNKFTLILYFNLQYFEMYLCFEVLWSLSVKVNHIFQVKLTKYVNQNSS